MKTYLVRVYSDIVGSGWYLVKSESEEDAMEMVAYHADLSRKTYTFTIEDLDIILSREYNNLAELSYV